MEMNTNSLLLFPGTTEAAKSIATLLVWHRYASSMVAQTLCGMSAKQHAAVCHIHSHVFGQCAVMCKQLYCSKENTLLRSSQGKSKENALRIPG
jgi:hypothetical protein